MDKIDCYIKSHYHPDVETTTTRERIQPWSDQRATCYCRTTSAQVTFSRQHSRKPPGRPASVATPELTLFQVSVYGQRLQLCQIALAAQLCRRGPSHARAAIASLRVVYIRHFKSKSNAEPSPVAAVSEATTRRLLKPP